ncbi:MAG: phosphoribosylaminoimidazolesuccinocarboxamide synthase [delta proteobacterium ML8_F1]|nr:MAG: phosphoribosylaminoimidazolesuccinocarboxamide synthase [delta proteobacterium ML8_F1]
MENRELLYEGKAKKIFATKDPEVVTIEYKDDATAFNGQKKGTITGKGVINNKISALLFTLLEEQGIPTHFMERISDRESLVKRVEIIPLEVIIRNVAAGSFSKRYGVEEGRVFEFPTFEFSYKDDSLGDPLINDSHALVMGLATETEIAQIRAYAYAVNDILKDFFGKRGIDLIDFKLEFGRLEGRVVLADEISPDTCRFWDRATGKKLDKDRFRQDLGEIEDAYEEIISRVEK